MSSHECPLQLKCSGPGPLTFSPGRIPSYTISSKGDKTFETVGDSIVFVLQTLTIPLCKALEYMYVSLRY